MRSCWSLKLSRPLVALVLAIPIAATAQLARPDSAGKLPLVTYRFPINPGSTTMLTGTMGELRNTHFHAGLDINTPRIGVPVQAAADGYISRATVSFGGYGHALYVTHADGNTTVYAHLDQFKGPLGERILRERYKRKTSEIDLFFTSGEFMVKQGDTLALSGNTGSSGGPHLHFEIRNAANEALNPLIFGFDEVQDHVAPVVHKVAFVTLDASARINDQFGRFEFYPVRSGSTYELPTPILAKGRIGIEVLAIDKMENSRFHYGINTIELKTNSQTLFKQHIRKIPFSQSREILTVMDFKSLVLRGTRYNKLYVDDGNALDFYENSTSTNGVVIDHQPLPLAIALSDFAGNTSTVQMVLTPATPATLVSMPGTPAEIQAEFFGNILKVTAPAAEGEILVLENVDRKSEVAAAYRSATTATYLVDLRYQLPRKLRTRNDSLDLHLADRVPSNIDYHFFGERMEVKFSKGSLFDTLYLKAKYDTLNGREIFVVGSRTVPLNKPIEVTLQPAHVPANQRAYSVYRQEGSSYTYLGGEWQRQRISFSTRELGTFTLLPDTVPPIIKAVSITGASARFRIRDGLSGIAYFEANIDGQWLLMNYDYKTGIAQSERLEKSKPLKGELEFKVVDNAGNETLFKQKIP